MAVHAVPREAAGVFLPVVDDGLAKRFVAQAGKVVADFPDGELFEQQGRVAYDFGDGRGPRGNDGAAGFLGFEDGDAESFVRRGVEQAVGVVVELVEALVADAAGIGVTVFQAGADQGFLLLTKRAAHHDEVQPALSDGLDGVREVLVGGAATHEEHVAARGKRKVGGGDAGGSTGGDTGGNTGGGDAGGDTTTE